LIPLIGEGSVVRKAPVGQLTVEGIIYDPSGGSVVIVKGEVYKPGDVLGDARIVAILKDRIILQEETEEKTLWLREEIPMEGQHS
jgi:hypothetical protein